MTFVNLRPSPNIQDGIHFPDSKGKDESDFQDSEEEKK